MWEFADHPGAFPVRVKDVTPSESIAFSWKSGSGSGLDVEVTFEGLEDGSTLVSITESGWAETDQGLQESYGNCQGWMQMAASLKAYLEYGVNLRQGFF